MLQGKAGHGVIRSVEHGSRCKAGVSDESGGSSAPATPARSEASRPPRPAAVGEMGSCCDPALARSTSPDDAPADAADAADA
jgi:hypothetical protein